MSSRAGTAQPVHLCHVFPTFACGGVEMRAVTIMNALGDSLRHSIVAIDGRFAAAERLDSSVNVKLIAPPEGRGSVFYGAPMWKLLSQLRPDLLLTYNWGSIDALIAAVMGRLCPVIHGEDGFNADEAVALKRRRVLARRVVLNRTTAMVVPSLTLRHIAINTYGVNPGKLRYIPNGVDINIFRPGRATDWRARYGIADTGVVFGAVGSLSPVKNLGLLVRAFAGANVPNSWLVLVGDGQCREELERTAAERGIGGRVIFVGATEQPWNYYRGFDVFVMSSLTEQMPLALLEAMASGLPAICPDVGDTANMLDTRQTPFIVPRDDEESLVVALRTLGSHRELRAVSGAANRKRCLTTFSLDRMIQSYRRLYFSAVSTSELATCVE
jgi:glycosyltransferase involved in cell wall biosynthesis